MPITFCAGTVSARWNQPYLTLSETVPIETDQSEELKEIKEKFEKYKILDEILDNLEQPKLEAVLQNLSKN